jgi:acyl-CoA thioester hydrolase
MAEPAAPHRLTLRVYYEDTDAAGIVYYANYLRFAERARTELLRALGFDHGRLRAERGLAFAVHRCEIDYHAPARLDDLLEVATTVHAVRGASLELDQRISAAGRRLASLRVRLALLDGALRPVRLPAALAAAFATQQAGVE